MAVHPLLPQTKVLKPYQARESEHPLVAGIDALGQPRLKFLEAIIDEHNSDVEFDAWNDGQKRTTT